MLLFNIKTNLGYYSGQSPEQYPVKLGSGYQNDGLNKIVWSNKRNAEEITTRGLSGIVGVLAHVTKENFEYIKFINIEMVKHGGKRKGAGRKKSDPTVVCQFRIDKQLLERVKAKHGSKEVYNKLRALLVDLDN